MKKKMLLMMSTALLTIGLLAGCSSEGEEDPNSGNLPKAPSEDPNVPTDQPVEPAEPTKPE
jgi:PBP1b-binding outer membrane lipoprotein LpoB